jgi:hypothetical protein
VETEDVVHVLSRLLGAVAPGGIVLDLQVIRPDPRVEADGVAICEIDGEPLFRLADTARAAVDERIAAGDLVEEAVDEHDVFKHYDNGRQLIDDWAELQRQVPESALPVVRAIETPCVTRERCRLRRLRVAR